MTAQSPSAMTLGPALITELGDILTAITGGGPNWPAPVPGTARLEQDLGLDSVEFTELASRLRERFGPAVDLFGHAAALGFDELLAFSVDDVAGYLGAGSSPGGSHTVGTGL